MAIDSLATYIAGLSGLGDRTAVIERGLYRSRHFSYAQIIGRAAAFRDELAMHHVMPGDRVLIWGPSGAAWTIAFYGCVLLGVVAVPLDAAFSAEYVRRIRQHTGAHLLCAPAERCSAIADVPAITFEQIDRLAMRLGDQHVISSSPDALLELVYTSGTTGEPKGVMITHGNLLANLRPIETEVRKYRKWAWPFLPLRFVHLIPLSHLFGQVLGLFIPTLIDSAVVYPESQAPSALADIIREQRASVLVAVPQQLELMAGWTEQFLSNKNQSLTREQIIARSTGRGVAWRWWQWRRLHRRLGWRMWAFIVGGASVPTSQEEFWSALGYAVVQGYGLTETAPAITITHPFKIRRGSVGKKVAGVDVKIALDGEILVRGGNVSPGYYRDPATTAEAFSEGWLRTGDLGRFDENGNLIFLGRKKDIIVTAEGMNVHPQDVERILDAQPEVKESAVVAEDDEQRTRVHAVVVPTPGIVNGGVDAAIARVNENLEPHQRVRAWSIWPQADLPRTASTHKLQRSAIAAWVNQGSAAAANGARAAAITNWRAFLAAKLNVSQDRLRPDARLDEELGVSSLDRLELVTWLEAHGHGSLDEFAISSAKTVGDVENLIEGQPNAQAVLAERMSRAGQQEEVPAPAGGEFVYPRWPHTALGRRLRALAYYLLVLPALRTVARIRIEGRQNLRFVRRPVLFVANHQSLLDVAAIIRALPARFRPWVAPAMGADAFQEYFRPRGAVRPSLRRRARRQYHLTQAFFNTYLLSEQTGIQNALRHTGKLIERGYCPLIFPEGARTKDGRLHRFRPGIGVFIRSLGIPVVPVTLEGLFEILPIYAEHAKRGTARVTLGRPIRFEGQEPEQITARLQEYFEHSLGPVSNVSSAEPVAPRQN